MRREVRAASDDGITSGRASPQCQSITPSIAGIIRGRKGARGASAGGLAEERRDALPCDAEALRNLLHRQALGVESVRLGSAYVRSAGVERRRALSEELDDEWLVPGGNDLGVRRTPRAQATELGDALLDEAIALAVVSEDAFKRRQGFQERVVRHGSNSSITGPPALRTADFGNPYCGNPYCCNGYCCSVLAVSEVAHPISPLQDGNAVANGASPEAAVSVMRRHGRSRSPLRSPDGPAASAICNAVVGAFKRTCGKGPTRVKAYGLDDHVAVVAQDLLTTLERTLVRTGSEQLVREARRVLADEVARECRAEIEQVTGQRVVGWQSQVDPCADRTVALVRLEPRSPAADPQH
jgi:uncharacterized protein YbcI